MPSGVNQLSLESLDLEKPQKIWRQNGLVPVIVSPLVTLYMVGNSASWEISLMLSLSADYDMFSLLLLAFGILGILNYQFILRKQLINAPCIHSLQSAQEDVNLASRTWSIIASALSASFAIYGLILNLHSHATGAAIFLAFLPPIIYFFLTPDRKTMQSFVHRKSQHYNAGTLPRNEKGKTPFLG